MALIALITANKVRVVESILQITLPSGEAIVAGAPVRLDVTTGKLVNAIGTAAAGARAIGVATKTVVAGEAVTAIRRGVMDGFNLDAQAYDLPIFLSDTSGRLGDAAGTVSFAVGRVISAHAQTNGTVLDKLLAVDM